MTVNLDRLHGYTANIENTNGKPYNLSSKLTVQSREKLLINDINAESTSQSARATQNSTSRRSAHPRRKAGIGALGRKPGSFASRASRAIGTEAVIGGILNQLIEDAEDQLDKTHEHVEWYQREAEQQLARLERLRQLRQQQLEQSAKAESR